MKCHAAVLLGPNQKWTIREIEVGEPRLGEVLVRWRSVGLCHSDDHLVTGDMVPPKEYMDSIGESFYPIIGGHEGAGEVVAVGPGVTSMTPGDHVSASFVPACGRCRYCGTGRQNLCDASAGTLGGGMITDGTPRHFLEDGTTVSLMSKVGTFAEYTCVAEQSVIRVDDDYPLDAVALVSCGVATGWGSATQRANVRPGDVTVVVGVGGIGINAVQGAAAAGARFVIAVDPVPMKLDMALKLGATHAYASMEEAYAHVAELTAGQLADQVIMTPSVMRGELLAMGLVLAGKGATVVVTAVAPMMQTQVSVSLFDLAMSNKEIKGTIFGSLNPRYDIPRLLTLYREGRLKLDELVTRRYRLDEINEAYDDLKAGTLIRGVIAYE